MIPGLNLLLANIPALCLFGMSLWLIGTDHPWWAAGFLFAGFITLHTTGESK